MGFRSVGSIIVAPKIANAVIRTANAKKFLSGEVSQAPLAPLPIQLITPRVVLHPLCGGAGRTTFRSNGLLLFVRHLINIIIFI